MGWMNPDLGVSKEWKGNGDCPWEDGGAVTVACGIAWKFLADDSLCAHSRIRIHKKLVVNLRNLLENMVESADWYIVELVEISVDGCSDDSVVPTRWAIEGSVAT